MARRFARVSSTKPVTGRSSTKGKLRVGHDLPYSSSLHRIGVKIASRMSVLFLRIGVEMNIQQTHVLADGIYHIPDKAVTSKQRWRSYRATQLKCQGITKGEGGINAEMMRAEFSYVSLLYNPATLQRCYVLGEASWLKTSPLRAAGIEQGGSALRACVRT